MSVSRSDLINQQQEDPSLSEFLSQLRPSSEMSSSAHGYFLQEGVLVRKWVPQSEGFSVEAIFQIVIPSPLRAGVIQTAHDDLAGHLGMQKTYKRVLLYFFGLS